MIIDIYSNFFIQLLLFVLLAFVLLISVISLFIKPAKRTIRASLVEAETGHIVDISRSETSIGRAKACDVVITDISTSRFHAVLAKRSTGWMIFDTNSTAGIKINGKKIEKKAVLKDGDSIEFGNSEYIFYSSAVTTRQQLVKKTRTDIIERPKYRKVTNPDDNNIRYKKQSSASSKSDETPQYEKRQRQKRDR